MTPRDFAAHLAACSATLAIALHASALRADGFIDNWIQSFADSEIVFARSESNAPFPPIAFASVSYYNDAEVRLADGTTLSYDQKSVSQAAAAPLLVTPRDALFIGEWLSWTEFDARGTRFDSFDVLTVGIPMGWIRQVNDSWQAGGFVMPLGHKADLPGAGWGWKTMGGVFGRYVMRDDLWWGMGFYFDIGPGDDTYLPYLGASWDIDHRWTLSAVMPWPAVLYAPDTDTLFRVGASPSGSSWSLRPGADRVAFTLDSWDFGFAAERRIHGNIWLGAEAGIGGLRGLRITDGNLDLPELDIGRSPYINVNINFRPSLR